MSNQFSPQSREYLNSELARWLRKASDRSEALIGKHLKPFGLSVSQGYVFGLIADRVLKGSAPLQKDLEEDMGLVTSSITNLVQGLERKGLIARRGSAADGRAKEIHVTDQGWKLREELGRRVTDWSDLLAQSLTDEELTLATQLLQKIGDHHEP